MKWASCVHCFSPRVSSVLRSCVIIFHVQKEEEQGEEGEEGEGGGGGGGRSGRGGGCC